MVLDREVRWSLSSNIEAPVPGMVGIPGLVVKEDVDDLRAVQFIDRQAQGQVTTRSTVRRVAMS